MGKDCIGRKERHSFLKVYFVLAWLVCTEALDEKVTCPRNMYVKCRFVGGSNVPPIKYPQ